MSFVVIIKKASFNILDLGLMLTLFCKDALTNPAGCNANQCSIFTMDFTSVRMIRKIIKENVHKTAFPFL